MVIDDPIVREKLESAVPEPSTRTADWGRVAHDAEINVSPIRRMRRRYVVIAALGLSILIVAPALGLRGILASQRTERIDRPDKPTVTTFFGVEPANLSADMQKAADAGAEEIQCEPGEGETLTCTEVGGEEALAAVRRGETVYGRNVLGMPQGADPKYNSRPKFEEGSLVCKQVEGAITCVPMSVQTPTVEEGQQVFAYYDKFDVEFGKDGQVVMHGAPLKYPLHVVADQ